VRPDVYTEAGRAIVAMVSKIPDEEILTAPLPADVWQAMKAFLDGLPVRAYNEEFDRLMLNRTLPEVEEVLVWGPPCGDNQAGWRMFTSCVMEAFCERFAMYSRMKDDLSGPYPFRLQMAAQILSLPLPDLAHRALADAILAGQIAMCLDAGVMPPETEILERIAVRIAKMEPVFHPASASLLPVFHAVGAPAVAPFHASSVASEARVDTFRASRSGPIAARPYVTADAEAPTLPRISLRRTS
jgi:DNA polymerase III epsilon subunit-like protein